MNKLQQTTLTAGKGLVYSLFTIIAGYLFIASLFGTCVMSFADEHIYYIKDAALLVAAGLVCMLFLLTWIRGELVKRTFKTLRMFHLMLAVTIIWLVFLSVMILVLRLKPDFDPGSVYYAASRMVQGNFQDWQPGGYLYVLNHQNGLALLETPFFLLFGDNAYIAFQFYNLILWLGTILLIRKITKDFFGELTANVTYLCLLAFIPMWSYITYVYGTIPGLFFSVLAICLERKFEETDQWKYILFAGLSMFLAIMYKTNYQIFALAIILMLLMHTIRTKSLRGLCGIIVLAAFMILEGKVVILLVELITGQSAKSGVPMIAWAAMGLRDSSIAPGWYNKYVLDIYEECNGNIAAVKQASVQSIRDTLFLFRDNVDYMASFFGRKIASLWNLPDFECFTTISKRNKQADFAYWLKDIVYNGGIVNTILFLLFDVVQSILYFGMVLHMICKRSKVKLEHAIGIVIFLGGFIFHLVWEGKAQYTIVYFILLVPYAVAGYVTATEKLGKINTAGIKTGFKNSLIKTTTGRLALLLAAVILILQILPAGAFASSLKIRGDESEYLWLCTEEARWKADDFHFEY